MPTLTRTGACLHSIMEKRLWFSRARHGLARFPLHGSGVADTWSAHEICMGIALEFVY